MKATRSQPAYPGSALAIATMQQILNVVNKSAYKNKKNPATIAGSRDFKVPIFFKGPGVVYFSSGVFSTIFFATPSMTLSQFPFVIAKVNELLS